MERRKCQKITGGGPPSDIFFKEWENLVIIKSHTARMVIQALK
jgi:hypothetical protein